MPDKLDSKILRAHKGISFVGVTTVFLCHDGNGSIYMARRGKTARDEQGAWDIGSGSLKWGHLAEYNVRREVKEEYGADALEIEFLGYDDIFRSLPDGTPTHWLALQFAVKVDRNQVFIAEPEVLDEGGWFTLKNLPSPLHSQLPHVFTKYKKEIEAILG